MLFSKVVSDTSIRNKKSLRIGIPSVSKPKLARRSYEAMLKFSIREYPTIMSRALPTRKKERELAIEMASS
jgi:hypothetical protein